MPQPSPPTAPLPEPSAGGESTVAAVAPPAAPRAGAFSGGNDGDGHVAFVGAGPGHPDLLTVRALERLRAADCVVFDALVPMALLERLPVEVQRVPVPRLMTGEDPGEVAGRLLVDLARGGRRVVRLKGGDPGIFGRLAEELAPVREAGIPWEIVPGVTAALAAAAAAGVPLTSRASASHLTILTGHEADEKSVVLDFGSLATRPGTLAVYMGVDQADRWAGELIAAGMPADTPVTVVSRCSWPDQEVATTTLGACSAAFLEHRWQAPAVVIVGAVSAGLATHASSPARFPSVAKPSLPLAGRRVLVTRPAGQGDDLAGTIAALGGSCLHIPALRIVAPESWQRLDLAIAEVGTFDWIVCASVNGVQGFLTRLRGAGKDGRAIGTARLAAIGPATRQALEAAGFVCDLQPGVFSSEGVVEAILPTFRSGRILLVRADRGREVMRREFEAAGHDVVEVAAYQSQPAPPLEPDALAAIDRESIDWITATSPAVAESAIRMFGKRMLSWKIASLSPVTSGALAAAGYPATVEAAEATGRALGEAMAAFEASLEAAQAPSPLRSS